MAYVVVVVVRQNTNKLKMSLHALEFVVVLRVFFEVLRVLGRTEFRISFR